MKHRDVAALVGWSLLAVYRPAAAQRPVDLNKLERVAGADLLPLPQDGERDAFIAFARTTAAVSVDSRLAPVNLHEWLVATLLPKVRDVPLFAPTWHLDYCEDRTSDIPGPSAELCASATAPVSETRTLTLTLAVGNAAPRADGALVWAPRGPEVRVIRLTSIAPRRDSLDVPSLVDLEEWLDRPVTQWPKLDLKAAIEANPPRVLQGDIVTFTMRAINVGARHVTRAEITLLLSPGPGGVERRYQWFPRVPVGSVAIVQLKEALPEGRGIAHVSVSPYFSDGTVAIESNPSDNSAWIWVHHVTDPPQFTPTPPVTAPESSNTRPEGSRRLRER